MPRCVVVFRRCHFVPPGYYILPTLLFDLRLRSPLRYVTTGWLDATDLRSRSRSHAHRTAVQFTTYVPPATPHLPTFTGCVAVPRYWFAVTFVHTPHTDTLHCPRSRICQILTFGCLVILPSICSFTQLLDGPIAALVLYAFTLLHYFVRRLPLHCQLRLDYGCCLRRPTGYYSFYGWILLYTTVWFGSRPIHAYYAWTFRIRFHGPPSPPYVVLYRVYTHVACFALVTVCIPGSTFFAHVCTRSCTILRSLTDSGCSPHFHAAVARHGYAVLPRSFARFAPSCNSPSSTRGC